LFKWPLDISRERADCTEECVVKMVWQLMEFEVTFASPTEIKLVFPHGDL
jgi:hypothetical protein